MLNRLKALAGIVRWRFLLLAPACVAVGVGASLWVCRDCVDGARVAWVLAGALCAHVSVNAFNEYEDFRSGLDAATRRTPFSGGSGVLPAHPELAPLALWIARGALAATLSVGAYFVVAVGLGLLPLGLAGVVIVCAYTSWISRHPILSLLAPGLGFGVLMVTGTHLVLVGAYSWTAFGASLTPCFLVSDLLLLNQLPDVEADRSVGRRTLPIAIGRRASVHVFGVLALCAYLSIVLGVVAGTLPPLTLAALGTMVLALAVYRGALRHAEDMERLTPCLALNAINATSTPVVLAAALMAG